MKIYSYFFLNLVIVLEGIKKIISTIMKLFILFLLFNKTIIKNKLGLIPHPSTLSAL